MSLAHVRQKYGQFYDADGRRLIGIEIERRTKKPLRAVFGKKPIHRQTGPRIRDTIQEIYVRRNSFIDRLLAETCELCEKEDVPLVGHHIDVLNQLCHFSFRCHKTEY